MLDLFQALAIIPELLIGAARHPKTIACLVLASIVLMAGAVVIKESSRPEVSATYTEPIEDRPKERRVTKVFRWLWHKE